MHPPMQTLPKHLFSFYYYYCQYFNLLTVVNKLEIVGFLELIFSYFPQKPGRPFWSFAQNSSTSINFSNSRAIPRKNSLEMYQTWPYWSVIVLSFLDQQLQRFTQSPIVWAFFMFPQSHQINEDLLGLHSYYSALKYKNSLCLLRSMRL